MSCRPERATAAEKKVESASWLQFVVSLLGFSKFGFLVPYGEVKVKAKLGQVAQSVRAEDGTLAWLHGSRAHARRPTWPPSDFGTVGAPML